MTLLRKHKNDVHIVASKLGVTDGALYAWMSRNGFKRVWICPDVTGDCTPVRSDPAQQNASGT